MRAPDWLTARPVAHRGLHDRSRGIVENMPGAALAAIDGNFAIECDIQLTADGEAMVHHDDALGRLTEGAGALLGLSCDRPEGSSLQGHIGADDVARRPLHSGQGTRPDHRRGQEPFRRRPPAGEADGGGARVLLGTGRRDVVRSGSGGGAPRDDAGTAARHRRTTRLHGSRLAGGDGRPSARACGI